MGLAFCGVNGNGPPRPRQELYIFFGERRCGKTRAIFSIANLCARLHSPARFFGLVSDPGAWQLNIEEFPALGEFMPTGPRTFSTEDGRMNFWRCESWEDAHAWREWLNTANLGPDDWLLIDKASDLWKWAPHTYLQSIGVDPIVLERNHAAARAADGKDPDKTGTLKYYGPGINPLFEKFYLSCINNPGPAHVIMVASEADLNEKDSNKFEKAIKDGMELIRAYHDVGMKPKLQSSTDEKFHGVFCFHYPSQLSNQFFITTCAERGKRNEKKFARTPIIDFACQYLLGVANYQGDIAGIKVVPVDKQLFQAGTGVPQDLVRAAEWKLQPPTQGQLPLNQ